MEILRICCEFWKNTSSNERLSIQLVLTLEQELENLHEEQRNWSIND